MGEVGFGGQDCLPMQTQKFAKGRVPMVPKAEDRGMDMYVSSLDAALIWWVPFQSWFWITVDAFLNEVLSFSWFIAVEPGITVSQMLNIKMEAQPRCNLYQYPQKFSSPFQIIAAPTS